MLTLRGDAPSEGPALMLTLRGDAPSEGPA